MREWLVVSEVAATLVLVVGTGSVTRTFARLNAVDPGFDPHGLIAGQVAMFDPATSIVAAPVLASAGLLASCLPARRAARLEPMTVLRSE
jgi:putative ABC transport system permease protein